MFSNYIIFIKCDISHTFFNDGYFGEFDDNFFLAKISEILNFLCYK